MANYWDARSFSFLSKKHLTIVAVDSNVQINKGINTSNDYVGKEFNFVIIQNKHTLLPAYPPGYDEFFETDKVEKALGKPLKIVECPAPLLDGKEKIYIYAPGVINSHWKV